MSTSSKGNPNVDTQVSDCIEGMRQLRLSLNKLNVVHYRGSTAKLMTEMNKEGSKLGKKVADVTAKATKWAASTKAKGTRKKP